jgi:hypothetical protein
MKHPNLLTRFKLSFQKGKAVQKKVDAFEESLTKEEKHDWNVYSFTGLIMFCGMMMVVTILVLFTLVWLR